MNKITSCTHETEVNGYWESNPYHDPYHEGSESHNWVDGHSKTLMVDIDTHRMKCSRCGAIGYYSSAARNFYENGVVSNIEGLEGRESSNNTKDT